MSEVPDLAEKRDLSSEQKLRDAVETTRALVSEAAMAGFRWDEGDWVERLFANQVLLTSALKLPSPQSPLDVRLFGLEKGNAASIRTALQDLVEACEGEVEEIFSGEIGDEMKAARKALSGS